MKSLLSFAVRGFRYHFRSHLGTLLACAVTTTAIVGALVVGDSLRGSLADQARRRLGAATHTLATGERLFRAALAEDLAAHGDLKTASVLELSATLSGEGGRLRVGGKVTGVDKHFWRLAPRPWVPSKFGGEAVAINAACAAKLSLAPGDELILRIDLPGVLPRDVPFAASETPFTMRRVTVANILTEDQFGSFDLAMAQTSGARVFMDREALAELLGKAGKANLLLVAATGGSISALEKSLAAAWRLSDLGLAITNIPGGGRELRSEHIFLDPRIEAAALAAGNDGAPGGLPRGKPVFTYFVNRLGTATRSTPYSMVAAPGEPLVASGTPDDAILINDWLAADLGAQPGDALDLAYWAFDDRRRLVEKTNRFRIQRILPLAGAAADASLMPDFPGLADTASCNDWHPGIPVDLKKIRPKDEAYWEAHRGTPKAFLTLAAARGLWSNAFGASTAVRWSGGGSNDAVLLEKLILAQLTPAAAGFAFKPAAAQARQGAAGSVDLGGLFLGLSLFLVGASLLLTALLAGFAIERRRDEIATLRALGFPASRIRLAFLGELALVSLFGGILGVAVAVLYDAAILSALNSVWGGAVAFAVLTLHLVPLTVVSGFVSSFVCGLAAGTVALQGALRPPIQKLRTGEARRGTGRKPAFIALGLGLAILLGALIGNLVDGGRHVSPVFFLAAVGALAASLAAVRLLFSRRAASRPELGRLSFILLGALRNRGRSLATIMLLSVGVFMVVGVSLYREDPRGAVGELASGSGGFAVVGEFTLPIAADLRDEKIRKRLGLTGKEWESARLTPMRRLEGDDASCLNLHRVKAPPILGVDSAAFAERGAFHFAAVEKGSAGNPWSLLGPPRGGAIPVIADESVLTWNLGKSVGDTIEMADERGEKFHLRVVAALSDSIFQGNLLMEERELLKHFPSVGGTRLLLIDAPRASIPGLSNSLHGALRDFGPQIETAPDRLARFTVVQNTYLTVFLALGGLGLILGSAGFAVVLLRNLEERRGEWALLRATGFSGQRLRRFAMIEHSLLLALGLGIGGLSAAVAAIPSLGFAIPWATALAVFSGCAVVGFASVILAAFAGKQARPLDSLRLE
ncbi:MAG: ABC transporter permease [Spirochaetes bacterium]|nr:ABC transporter permease [Spirochaetota bacterium]